MGSGCQKLCVAFSIHRLPFSYKGVGIKLQSIHESYWTDDQKTWDVYPNGGDKLSCIATHTMISDCLTKSMKPDCMIRVLAECMYKVQKQ